MIAVINYGMGNLGSVKNALDYIGVESYLTDNPEEVEKATAVILPGVGAFGDAMNNLRTRSLEEPIVRHIEKGKPFLGICLGLQMLFEESAESPGVRGLGIIDGSVEKFPEDMGFKVPQIGWNSIETTKKMPVLKDFNGEYVYFVHSYFGVPSIEDDSIIRTRYGMDFCSAVETDNILACQFHPEKSGKAGLAILKKWTELNI